MKAVRALVIRPNNQVTERILRGLPDYKEALDGAWLESIALVGGVMYVDEEFLLKDFGPSDANAIATRLVRMVGLIEIEFPLLGPAIVVGLPDREGFDTDIPEPLVKAIRRIETNVKAKDN